MSRPSNRMRPEVGVSSPAMMRSAVDLPQPEGPTSETNSPSAMSRLKLLQRVHRAPVGAAELLVQAVERTVAMRRQPFTPPAPMPVTR